MKAMKDAFNMTRQRCYNKKCRDYPYYGGRGIVICDRWLKDFNSFVSDMGPRPPGMTLERRDNNGPYSPDNCIWATRKRQAINRRVALMLTHNGITRTVAEWAEITGISYSTLKARVQRLGYSAEDALTKPVKCGGLLPGRVYRKRRKPDMSHYPRGMASPKTSLTAAQVREMRRLYRRGRETFTSLSRLFNVSVETASNAVQGLGAYKEVT